MHLWMLTQVQVVGLDLVELHGWLAGFCGGEKPCKQNTAAYLEVLIILIGSTYLAVWWGLHLVLFSFLPENNACTYLS